MGWELFPDHIFEELNQNGNNLIFMLWGKESMKKSSLINAKKHTVLTAAHPSPLSAYRGKLSANTNIDQQASLVVSISPKPTSD